MNELSEPTPQQPEGTPQPAAAAPEPPANRSLGVELSESYEVLQEDLLKANQLTANLEAELAGKSKEVLHLKFLFEQTKAHMGHMQDSIAAMRKERHKLANDAMRAMGLDIMVARLKAERDRLQNELNGVLEGLANENTQKALRFDKRDHQIAELTFEVMNLRQEVADLRRVNPRSAPASPPPRPMPLKTSAEAGMRDDPDAAEMEIIPTERVAGFRGKA